MCWNLNVSLLVLYFATYSIDGPRGANESAHVSLALRLIAHLSIATVAYLERRKSTRQHGDPLALVSGTQ